MVIYAKENKPVETLGYTNVWFTINGLWKVLFRSFRYFHFSIINISFAINFMKKATIF